MREDFAVFILAHGRPDKLVTVDALKRAGYTGKYYIILDDEDPTVDCYNELFGKDHCVVFSKSEVAKKFDVMDNFEGRNVVVFARNACNDIARSLGIKYFAEFEDDYFDFRHRMPDPEDPSVLRAIMLIDFDEVVDIMIEFIDSVSAVQPNFRTIAMAQSGEMMGGVNGAVWKSQVKRKAMNTFFFKVPETADDDVMFIGRMNDDVNTYISDGCRGGLWFQTAKLNLDQALTQKQSGGNTDAYLKYGTYQKSFYSVMLKPDCVKIGMMGESHARIHHNIDWKKCVPVIINEKWKKK